jgi:hypothetical protein
MGLVSSLCISSLLVLALARSTACCMCASELQAAPSCWGGSAAAAAAAASAAAAAAAAAITASELQPVGVRSARSAMCLCCLPPPNPVTLTAALSLQHKGLKFGIIAAAAAAAAAAPVVGFTALFITPRVPALCLCTVRRNAPSQPGRCLDASVISIDKGTSTALPCPSRILYVTWLRAKRTTLGLV